MTLENKCSKMNWPITDQLLNVCSLKTRGKFTRENGGHRGYGGGWWCTVKRKQQGCGERDKTKTNEIWGRKQWWLWTPMVRYCLDVHVVKKLRVQMTAYNLNFTFMIYSVKCCQTWHHCWCNVILRQIVEWLVLAKSISDLNLLLDAYRRC